MILAVFCILSGASLTAPDHCLLNSLSGMWLITRTKCPPPHKNTVCVSEVMRLWDPENSPIKPQDPALWLSNEETYPINQRPSTATLWRAACAVVGLWCTTWKRVQEVDPKSVVGRKWRGTRRLQRGWKITGCHVPCASLFFLRRWCFKMSKTHFKKTQSSQPQLSSASPQVWFSRPTLV